jgi:hypothetical protein
MKSERPGNEEMIPTLTEIVELEGPAIDPQVLEVLHTEISARVMRLAEELMREASRDLESILLKRVCDQLRVRLPEIVEDAVREYLGTEF